MLKVMARKLELSNTVMTKATEYRRLADIKCSVLLKQYSDSCMCVVCLELASKSVGAQFNKVCVFMCLSYTVIDYGHLSKHCRYCR